MTNNIAPEPTLSARGDLIAGRFEVVELLGRGGMACVYRVKDRATEREVALKQLVTAQGSNSQTIAALFEREFHTLAQLSHPHVIAVYDYGLDEDNAPFYTMELLDGGDLRDRAPVAWRDACRLLFDVCSSLALLHSRRLLHRDISPRNIRCTHDGRAKLIDFGAMAPMSTGGGDVVGTPAFVAPETLHRLAVDARTDLFSLGVTLYHALTGRLPYPARTFADAMAAWQLRVAPASQWTPDIPAALDDLVLALISVEPALRPVSAFEVMQRLAAIAGLQASESEAVSAAYLATPTLVGRDAELYQFREKLLASRLSRGGALLISGSAGVGRSRVLDACALEAKTLGFTVMRATASATREALSTVHGLTKHLLDALPSAELGQAPAELLATPAADSGQQGEAAPRPRLRDFRELGLGAEPLQQAICGFWLRVSRKRPLLIAIDDVHRIDSASAAVLAALLDKSRRAGIFVALSAGSDEPASEALTALARRCTTLKLEPLTREQTRQLLGSVFGDVSNLDMLAHELHEVALGNPRQTMDVAQQLVDRGVIRYAGGAWTLPARLAPSDLPRNGEEALRARVEALSPNARFLAETHALAFYESLRDHDYRALLPQLSSQSVETALSELLSVGALAVNGSAYTIANRLWTAALHAALDPQELPLRHRALAAMYEPSSRVAFISHAFAAGWDERALDALAKLNAGYAVKLDHEEILAQNVPKMMLCYPRALESAQRLGMGARTLNELRRWHFAGSATLVEDAVYPESALLWRAQLEHDSGLDLYRADPVTSDTTQRLMRALQGAQERYLATPEIERVYTVEEAIRLLAEYVVFGLALGGRMHDTRFASGLPGLLEPFIALSPLLDAIWHNASASSAGRVEGDFPRARQLWLTVLEKLDAIRDTSLSYVDAIANAVCFAVGCMETQLGIPTATSWADRLDRDPHQRVSALQLRRIARLEQGDWKGAERFRRQAEVVSLQARGPQMFNDLLNIELNCCAAALDLAGVQEALQRVRALSARFPGWATDALHGEARFHAVRGDDEAAKLKFEACIALTEFDAKGFSTDPVMWLGAQTGLSEALLNLGDAEAARATASAALERWKARHSSDSPVELVRALAMAEAKLGLPSSVERMEGLIAQQTQLGVSGLRLGVTYEMRARLAIWQGDAAAFERYAELTAREFRYGADSPLGARYDRLLNEAGRSGLRARHSLAEFATPGALASSMFAGDDVKSMVLRTMARSTRTDERAAAALQLICDSRNASCGHLYLMSPAGLRLSASRGDGTPAPALSAVLEFLVGAQDRAEELDDMVTGESLETSAPNSSVQMDTLRYDLLLLSCVIDDDSRIAGIVAVTASDVLVDVSRQNQLLSALATHLLEGGDNTGVGVSL